MNCIRYERYVRQKIETGIKAGDEGKVVSHEGYKEAFYQEKTRSFPESV